MTLVPPECGTLKQLSTLSPIQVMEVFQEMVYKGCERSVITYSSLISACEKVCYSCDYRKPAGLPERATTCFQEVHLKHQEV